MEHLTKSFEIKALEGDGSFEAVIATLNVKDHDDDVTLPGAFGKQTVSILPAHNSGSVSLGKATIEEVGDKVIAKGNFNLDIQAAREMHSALKFDLADDAPIQEWSYGYGVKESAEDVHDGQPVRNLIALEVFEISTVLKGAGIGTGTIAAKEKEGRIALADELEAAAEVVTAASKRAGEVIAMRLKQMENGERTGKPGLGAKAKESLEKLIGGLALVVAQREELKKLLGQLDQPSVEEKLLADYWARQSGAFDNQDAAV